MLRRRLASYLALSLASAWGAPALVAPAPSASPRASQECSLPITYDSFEGFRVGVPQGWEVSSLGGVIEVSKDASGREAALIYPAVLTKGLTPEAFFSSYMVFQQRQLASEGIKLTFKMEQGPNGLPLAAIRLQVGRVALAGFARAILLALSTPHSSQEVVFSAWWAPAARWAADSANLIGISHCYSNGPGQVFRILRGANFTYILPLGWGVTEQTDSLFLTGLKGDASVYYLNYGVPPRYDTPDLVMAHIFQVEGITVDRVLSTVRAPDEQLPAGGGVQAQEYVEFLGRAQGKTIHALAYILADSGSGPGTTGVLRLGAATTGLWNSVNGGLVEMMGAIYHSFVQDLQEIQHLDQQWQGESQQEASFDNIINGYQVARDPTTGNPYFVPLEPMQGCPAGASYCLPGGQQLVPVKG